MSVQIQVECGGAATAVFRHGKLDRAIARALSKAGSNALRDMRAEASKRIRHRKRIRIKHIHRAFRLRRPERVTVDGMAWALDVSGKPIALTAYPHRQTRRGVVVEVNRGKQTLIKHAFLATLSSGHKGVFVREGSKRLPIRELLGSRPVDALLHRGEAEAVAARGEHTFGGTFNRLLPLELTKLEQGLAASGRLVR